MTDFYLEDAEQLIRSKLRGIRPAEIEAAHEFLGRDTPRYQVDLDTFLLDVAGPLALFYTWSNSALVNNRIHRR